MATTAELLTDAFDRVREVVHDVLSDLGPSALAFRADPEANPISWLVWHLTRVQDDHIADVAGVEQRWTADGWYERFGLPFERDETGYGQRVDDVAKVAVDATLLAGYHDAVHDATLEYLRTLRDDDLDRIVDTRWDPPVTLGVRLVSVISDSLQHAGQAAYVKGIALRR